MKAHRQTGRIILAGLLIAVLVSCQSERDDVIVVYSAGPRPLIEAVVAAFEAENDIEVELFAATTGQVMARLEAEKYRPRADVVVLASELGAAGLKRESRLRRYRPVGIDGTQTDWHDPDGYYHATGAAIVAMAFRGDAPSPPSWRAALAGDWDGRLTMPSPSRSGSAADFLIAFNLDRGDEVWQQWLDARSITGLEFSAANNQAITSLVLDAYDGMLAAADYLIYRQMDRGADLSVHYPTDGSVLVTRPIAILDSTPQPEWAERFVDHYFSEAMQQAVADQFLVPARKDVETAEIRPSDLPDTLIRADMKEALEQQIHILRRFQLEIERAQVVRR